MSKTPRREIFISAAGRASQGRTTDGAEGERVEHYYPALWGTRLTVVDDVAPR